MDLRKTLASDPVFKLPNFPKAFTVESDASSTGIGAVLTQEGRPLAYFSKALRFKGQLCQPTRKN